MFTQEEQYTDLLEPIPEPQLVPQNDNHVTFVAPSMVQSGGTIETSFSPNEETHAHQETVNRNLVDQVAQGHTQEEGIDFEELFALVARIKAIRHFLNAVSSKLMLFGLTIDAAHLMLLGHKCISAKRTAWNEFSSSMALAVIFLATGREFNLSKYIFDSLVRNVDSPSKFLMRIEKGFLRVDTPLFDGMLVPQQVQDVVEDATEDEDGDHEVLALLFSEAGVIHVN
uniref:Uncharacterized protein n=1 Tax=Tanacetum cinerariifolium TaxID=118510 RepID=A0A6L2MVY5_TANCI|nr:hypothetical protein [Tanacetum cinerariifolium]